jgi:hypothetical protein
MSGASTLTYFQIGVLWITQLCDAIIEEYDTILHSFSTGSIVHRHHFT